MRKINRAGLISTHAPYTEGDSGMQRNGLVSLISTHAPYTEGDNRGRHPSVHQRISTHAPYTEGDHLHCQTSPSNLYFNSRPLYRGRRYDDDADYNTNAFQLTPPIQRATQNTTATIRAKHISTHAPYTEGDETGSANH